MDSADLDSVLHGQRSFVKFSPVSLQFQLCGASVAHRWNTGRR